MEIGGLRNTEKKCGEDNIQQGIFYDDLLSGATTTKVNAHYSFVEY